MTSLMIKIWWDQRGQDTTEYALMAGLVASIAVAVMPEMFALAGQVDVILKALVQAGADAAVLGR